MKVVEAKHRTWRPVSGIQRLQTLRLFRGLNRLDTFSIERGYADYLSNLNFDDFPTMTVLPDVLSLTRVGTGVLGSGVWQDKELHAVFNDGSWRKWTGSAWTSLKTGLNTSAKWTFTNYMGNLDDICLFGTNGVNGLLYYDGSTIKTIATAPSGLDLITTYQHRLWGVVDNTLHACALDQPDKWSLFEGDETDSYFIEVESPHGASVTALKSGLQKLTVGLEKGLQLLYGGVPSEFQLMTVTEDIGIANNRAADTLEGVMYLMDGNSLYQFAGGTLPDKQFSQVIQKELDANSADPIVGNDGKKLFVALTGKTLIYDPHKDIWTVLDKTSTCMAAVKGKLYWGNSGYVYHFDTKATDDTAWAWTSGQLFAESMAQKVRLYRLWVTVDLPAGSDLTVSLSQADGGESDHTSVKTITTDSDITSTRIEVPLAKINHAHWVRIHLAGHGACTIHEIAWQLRELPIT